MNGKKKKGGETRNEQTVKSNNAWGDNQNSGEEKKKKEERQTNKKEKLLKRAIARFACVVHKKTSKCFFCTHRVRNIRIRERVRERRHNPEKKKRNRVVGEENE